MKKTAQTYVAHTLKPLHDKSHMSEALMGMFVMTRCSGGDLWLSIQEHGPVAILSGFRAFASRRGASEAILEYGAVLLLQTMEDTAAANGYDLLTEYVLMPSGLDFSENTDDQG